MKQLKYFIGGIIFILAVPSIVNKLLELILLWIEALKIKPIKITLQGNADSLTLREFLREPEVELDDEEYREIYEEYGYDDED